jgi:sugar phosphate isomerase/epimerase
VQLPDLREIALAPLTLGRPPAGELAAAASAAGFGRIGLTLRLPDGDPAAVASDAAGRRALRARLDALGLRVLDAGVLVLAPGTESGDEPLVEAAADLGADRLVALVRDGEPVRAAGRLAAAAATAGAAGLRVGVEPMPYTPCRTLGAARALVAASGSSDAGVVVDVLHLFRSGGTAADLAGLDAAGIVLVQLCDGPAAAPPAHRLREEALTDRRHPGRGELPVREVLAALPDGVPLTVESPVAAEAGRSPVERARAAAAALEDLREDRIRERRAGPSTPSRR